MPYTFLKMAPAGFIIEDYITYDARINKQKKQRISLFHPLDHPTYFPGRNLSGWSPAYLARGRQQGRSV